MVSHAGFHPSPARTFATYGGSKFAHEVYGNVPLGMRALADQLYKSDQKHQKSVFAKRMVIQGKGGRVERSLKRYEKVYGGNRFMLGVSVKEQDKLRKQAAKAREYKKYFIAAAAAELSPEEAVEAFAQPKSKPAIHDPSTTTYLLLPLAPSFTHLLSPPDQTHTTNSTTASPRDCYTTADVPPLPQLVHSVLPIHQAFDQHARTKLGPLLTRLGAKVTLVSPSHEKWLKTFDDCHSMDSLEPQDRVEVQVMIDPSSHEPEALRLTFRGWTSAGVRELIGGTAITRQEERDHWWHLYSVVERGNCRHHQDTSCHDTAAAAALQPVSECSHSMDSFDMDSIVSSDLGGSVCSYTPSSSSSTGSILFESSTTHLDDSSLTEEEAAWRLPSVNRNGVVSATTSGAESADCILDWDLEQVEWDTRISA